MRKDPTVSVGIPLYNEEQNIPELVRRVRAVLDDLPGEQHEIVFVNDGSTDRTLELLEEEAARDPDLVVVNLSRNYGHQAAVTALLEHAANDVVVIMDGDLQDSPEAIPRFVEKYKEGFDVVYATRIKRKENLLLRVSYFLFYRLMRLLSNVPMPLDSGDFSLLSRRVIAAINSTPEFNRYVRGLRAWAGFEQVGIPVERAARQSGQSKYGVKGLVKLAFDGIFSFSVVPLRLATLIGLLMVFLSAIYGAYALYVKLFLGQSPVGFTALILTVIMLSGIQLVFLGVIGEYVGRIYWESKGRPVYVVEKIINRKMP